MKNLFRFIAGNYFFLMFLALQVVGMSMVVRYNNYQRVAFLNSSNAITAYTYKYFNHVWDFFSLKQANIQLAEENARLKNRLQQLTSNDIVPVIDSIANDTATYSFMTAKVINNSVNRQNNYFTISKGRKDGVEEEMGIISPGGIVGIVTDVSDHFATGPTVLNKLWRVSAKIGKNNYFGSLSWDGTDYRMAQLNEIPFHIELSIGDTIVTSGYSTVFPEGIMIGQIEKFHIHSGDNFYHIDVRLSTDFLSLSHVEVVKHNYADEIKTIENNRY